MQSKVAEWEVQSPVQAPEAAGGGEQGQVSILGAWHMIHCPPQVRTRWVSWHHLSTIRGHLGWRERCGSARAAQGPTARRRAVLIPIQCSTGSIPGIPSRAFADSGDSYSAPGQTLRWGLVVILHLCGD